MSNKQELTNQEIELKWYSLGNEFGGGSFKQVKAFYNWVRESKLTPHSVEQSNEQDVEREVNHIFESGANEIRVIELIKRLVSRKSQAPSVDGEFKHHAANFWKDKSDELKDLVWRLDREIWARVENKTASSSWARFASAELILQYIARREGSAPQEPKESNVCEKCWNDAYLRMMSNPSKGQAEHYRDLLEERKDNPCVKEPEPEQPSEPKINSAHSYTEGADVPSEQEQRELFSLIYRIMDQGGRPEDRFVISRIGSAPIEGHVGMVVSKLKIQP